jgi:biopolymer transport protein ExbB
MRTFWLSLFLVLPLAARCQQPDAVVPSAGTSAIREPLDGGPATTETAEAPDFAAGPSLAELFQSGGFLMWPILLCSVVMVAFGLERAFGLRTARIFPEPLRRDLATLAREGRIEEAVARCSADKSPFSRLMLACLQRADNAGFEMEAALEEAGARVLYDLRRNCKPLAVVADVSPLLGLMGTVTGMIKAFDVVARSGALGRTELLAAGISEALLTTAFGLLVAIPAVVLYHIFRGKAENLLRMMEDAALEILTLLRHAARNGGARS